MSELRASIIELLNLHLMWKNYLKIAFRQISRQKLYSFINIAGLAVGMSICLLVFLFAKEEYSYDQWYEGAEHIYRVNGVFLSEDGNTATNVTPWPLASMLTQELPEVESATRLQEEWWGDALLKVGIQSQYSPATARVDSNFFEVFKMPFLFGDRATAFDKPDNVVISKKLAEYFFGLNNPVGKTINYSNRKDYIISGVIDDLPGPSHFEFDLYRQFAKKSYESSEWVSMFNYNTYAKLRSRANPDNFEENINRVMRNNLKSVLQQQGVMDMDSEDAKDFLSVAMTIQPMTDIHFGAAFASEEIKPTGSRRLIKTFLLIALTMLLIAVINFMNLSTARSVKRAKEVGIRKVVGATRSTASSQFLTEAMLQSILAFVIALVLTQLTLPIFGELTGAQLTYSSHQFFSVIAFGIPFALVVGLLAGSYPAFFLSRFQPIRVLQGDFSRSKEGKGIRKALVVGQFLCCGALLLFLFHVVQQVNYMHSKDLGFSGEQVVVVPLQKKETNDNFDAIRNELLQHSGIESISQVNRLPGEGMGGNNYTVNGIEKLIDFNQVDENFVSVMKLDMLHGQFFTKQHLQDTFPQYIVNESFIKSFGIEADPIGQMVSRGTYERGQIVGVVKDFHWKGFTEEIQPFVLQEYNAYIGKAAIRIKADQVAEVLPFLQEKWSVFEPGFPLRYTFLNEDFAALYEQYINFGRLLTYLAVLILFTALLGLFGLAVFMAEQRTKEIGIRKVLGASVEQLTYLLVKDFSKLVLLGGLLAIPVGWYAANYWLADFAYRISIQPWVFVLALAVLLVVALLTVSTQAIRASLANPVHSLKDE